MNFNPVACLRPHYHPRVEAGAIASGLAGPDSTAVVRIDDPDPAGCGLGLIDEFERIEVPLTSEQAEALLEVLDSL